MGNVGGATGLIHLVHDRIQLAEATRECLAAHATVAAAPGGAYPATARPGDLLVLLADLRAAHAIRTVQHDAAVHGVASFVVGLEPGYVWFGPYRPAGAVGCFGCLQQWMQGNLGRADHWSVLTEPEPGLRREPQSPLAHPARRVYQELLSTFVGAIRTPASPFNLTRRVVRLQTQTLEVSRHVFTEFPSCPLCSVLPPDSADGARLRLQPRLKHRAADHRAPNPALSVERLRERFVDRRSGLVKHVFHDVTSSLMPLCAAEMPIAGVERVEVGYGRTETRRMSEMVAILEILERFAGHAPRRTRTSVRASYAQVRDRAVNPADFVLHAPEQAEEPAYRLVPYTEDLEYDWCWAYSFRRGEPVLIPQQLAYYRLFDEPGVPVNRFVYDSSSGCALGGSLEEAALYGLLEAAERDAYLVTWYGRLAPVELDLATARDERIRALVARSDAAGFELHVFDIRTDTGVPVVWSMIVDPRPDAPVKSYCASAAHFDPEQAIFGALVEVVTSMGVYQHTMPAQRERAREMFEDGSKVQTMVDHVLLYSLPETIERLSFLGAGGRTAAIHDVYAGHNARAKHLDLTTDLTSFVETVLNVASDVLLVNQTFSALQEIGISCVKVLAPGLMPVSFGHQHRRVSVRRVNQVRRARGVRPLVSAQELNPFPHNFP